MLKESDINFWPEMVSRRQPTASAHGVCPQIRNREVCVDFGAVVFMCCVFLLFRGCYWIMGVWLFFVFFSLGSSQSRFPDSR